MNMEYAEELATVTAFIHEEMGGSIIDTIDDKIKIAKAFIEKYPIGTDWENVGDDFESILTDFIEVGNYGT